MNYKAASSIGAQAKSIWISLDPASPGRCNISGFTIYSFSAKSNMLATGQNGVSFSILLYSFVLYQLEQAGLWLGYEWKRIT